MEITSILREIPLFDGLTGPQLEDLAMIITDQDFKKGTTIFAEGDEGTGFFILISGQVKIYKLSMDGKEQILHIVGPRELLGAVSAFAGDPYPAHADAMEKTKAFFSDDLVTIFSSSSRARMFCVVVRGR